MALGTTYNNNQQNQQQQGPSVNVISGYRWYNEESTIDQTRLTAKMWGNSLQLEIAPKKANSTGEFAEYDEQNSVKIYLNHTKARMLYNEIKLFLDDNEKYNSSGVPSGTGLITISNGKEFGQNKQCLIIRRLDPETGGVLASFAYEFRTQYHYSVRNFNESTLEFTKEYEAYNELEVGQLMTLLKEYYTSMTNATAFSVMNAMKYDYRTNQKIDGICEALNVSVGGQKYNNSKGSKSFFDNNKTTTAPSPAHPTKTVSAADFDDALYED